MVWSSAAFQHAWHQWNPSLCSSTCGWLLVSSCQELAQSLRKKSVLLNLSNYQQVLYVQVINQYCEDNYHICHSVIKQAPGVHSRREGVGCWWWDGWAGRRCPHPQIRQSCDCHQKALPSCCHPGLASAPSVLWRSWEGAPAAMMRSPGSRKPWNAGCQLSRLDQHSYNTKQRHINKTLNSQLSQLEENTLYMS